MPAPSPSGRTRRSPSARLRIAYKSILVAILMLMAAVLRPFLALFALFGVPRWWPAAVWFRVFLPAIGVRVVEHGKPANRPALTTAPTSVTCAR